MRKVINFAISRAVLLMDGYEDALEPAAPEKQDGIEQPGADKGLIELHA